MSVAALGAARVGTARRELFEETGAVDFDLAPLCVYSVRREPEGEASFGLLCHAHVRAMGELPHSEIGETALLDNMPDLGELTYPLIQPALMEYILAEMAQVLPTQKPLG